jgi:hypothetical protein
MKDLRATYFNFVARALENEKLSIHLILRYCMFHTILKNGLNITIMP